MATKASLKEIIEPLVEAQGLELFDLDRNGSTLVITVDRSGGIDVDALASVTRAISRALDDADPIDGKYTLEVTSPGLERKLRTPRHFAWAVGRQVAIKTVPDYEGERRISGMLTASDDETATVTDPAGTVHTIALDQISSARTIFEWGPAPKPGSPARRSSTAEPGSSTRRVESK